MSVGVVPTIALEDDFEPKVNPSMQRSPVERTDILSVWNEPSLNSIVDQSNYLEQEVEQLQISSLDSDEDSLLVYEKERQQVAFLAAVEILNGVRSDENHRKSSDSVIHLKTSDHRQKPRKKRCLSDTNGSRIDIMNISPVNVNESNLVRFDSGIAEARPIELSSLEQTPLTLSDGESSPPVTKSVVSPSTSKTVIGRSGSLDERVMRQLLIEDDTSSHHSGASSGSRNRRPPTVKHLSQCSMGGSSTSYSSFYECASNTSFATDILSGLGFDDFDNPELIPDRFIPNEIEHAKPTLMKETAILVSCTPDVYHAPPIPPPPPPPPMSYSSSAPCTNDYELPLGATADNFLPSKTNRSQSPPPSSPPSIPLLPHQYVDHYIERKYSVYAVTHPYLETVPEETASDLSPSPRWLSPRVSLDHSGLDLSMPHLGANLAAANRKRSLPNRDGYKLSVDSMLSEQDSTVYFSITSYDDDIAKELEDAVPPPLPLIEDSGIPRRRRKGVHGAPQELLSWLQTNPIHEEHNDDESWPFNEQLRLRRSLTEIEQRRSRTSSSEMIDDRSLSPLPFHDPFASIFPRRFSINGPLLPQMCPPSELRRLSLPSNSSFRQYNPAPVPVLVEEEEEELETDDILSTSNSIQSAGTEPSLRIPSSESLEYKQEAFMLRSEVEEMNSKLQNSDRVMKGMQEDFRKKFSDTQEWLYSELGMKDRRCRELEEMVERQKRDLLQLQQNHQIRISRAKEDMCEIKDKEIRELHQKMKQKEHEFMKREETLEEKCKHLHSKEVQLLKKINQHGTKSEKEELHREIALLKEQLKKEKELMANSMKKYNLDIKQLRAKMQIEKEDALKQLKHHLRKLHDMEVNSIKQQVMKGWTYEGSSPSRQVKEDSSSSKAELKSLRLQIDRKNIQLQSKEDEVQDLYQKLQVLQKEHLNLQQRIANQTK